MTRGLLQLVIIPDATWNAATLRQLFNNLKVDSDDISLRWVDQSHLGARFYKRAWALQTEHLGPQSACAVRLGIDALFGPMRALFTGECAVGELEISVELEPTLRPERVRAAIADLKPSVVGRGIVSALERSRCEDVIALLEQSGVRDWKLVLPTKSARAAVLRLFQLAAARANPVVEPFRSYLDFIRRWRNPQQPSSFFDPRFMHPTLVVGSDGRLNGTRSLLKERLGDVLSGSDYQRSLRRAERAMHALCGRCRFYGGCPGRSVAEAAVAGRRRGAGCDLQPLLAHAQTLIAARAPNTKLSAERALSPDVQIRSFARTKALHKRITLSHGTGAPDPNSLRYHVGGLIPQGPWRGATRQELRVLCCDQRAPWHHGSSVAIFALPEHSLAGLRAICGKASSADDVTSHPGWTAAFDRLLHSLKPYCPGSTAVDRGVLYFSKAGPTVTRVERGQKDKDVLLGLHVDSWEGSSLTRRGQLGNRMCINLSQSSRYFLFVNLTLGSMMEMLGLSANQDIEIINLFSGHKFLRRFPWYPVVRLELLPGEAYIAPTGNIIHDGSAEGTGDDVAFHLLGRFQPLAISTHKRLAMPAV